ncbi:hypothetical protein SLEP1_g32757 [Rubroshorea leprosula]|uniref:Secreted protein n=1 Tax=Rubroshorea leprosula TaxID=152421 RepID=A0AAV5KED8_9ROSI|nr:hypothetical protein SLEP1_g32757 [Rubroshorea leprosula]
MRRVASPSSLGFLFFLMQILGLSIPFPLQMALPLQPAIAFHPTDPFSPSLPLIFPFPKTVNRHPFFSRSPAIYKNRCRSPASPTPVSEQQNRSK